MDRSLVKSVMTWWSLPRVLAGLEICIHRRYIQDIQRLEWDRSRCGWCRAASRCWRALSLSATTLDNTLTYTQTD